MKRVFKFIFAAFIICLLPHSLVSAQEKKSEKRIKIVVSDGSDTKIMIDTLMEGDSINDSITLKDGKIIYIGNHGDETTVKSDGNNEHISLFVSSDEDHSGKKVKEITVISSDSLRTSETGKHGNIYVYNNSGGAKGKAGGNYRVVTATSSNESGKGKKSYYIKEDNNTLEGNEKTYVYINGGDQDSTVDKSRYVIAKDGIVVTVEGSDETRAKELVREIEKSMGIKSSDSEKNVRSKSESKKAVRK
jgi:hypothetical protein